MTNLAVGDALANFQMFETVLMLWDMSLEDVDALYHDFPNCLLTVKVEKKEWFVTDWEDEWILLEPKELYEEINQLVSSF